MKNAIENFNKQFQVGLRATEDIKINIKPKGVCICGMGGSALPGNLLDIYLEKRNFPLLLQRDYNLPKEVSKDWLLVCISYSGNTEETLSCLREAQEKELETVLVSSDGSLKKIAEENNLPIAILPQGLQPRIALGYQFSALAKIIEKAGLIDSTADILELEEIKADKEKAKEIAEKIKGKIPLIYASNKLKTVARIFKIAFNENSKIPAFWNYFPELNHNEMVGFQKKQEQFYLLILKDQDDTERIKKRMDLTKKLLEKKGLKGEIIEFQEQTLLKRVFSGILFSYWISYYLALLYNIDPEPVELVEEFKKLMEK
jgi:glucose/mannose-6-phosphate isomerase